MEELKQQLKSILVNDTKQLFKQLRELLLVSSAAYTDVILQESRFNRTDSDNKARLISNDDADLQFNQINNCLSDIIDKLEARELKSSPSIGQGLQGYHSFTCDRVEQNDRFQQLFTQRKSEKTHFFYLYGLDLQSHKGIFRRIAFDLEGRLQDYLNPGLNTGSKSFQLELTFDLSRDMDVFKQNGLKNLFAAFAVRVNEHEPILQKNLAWLQQNSPLLQGFGGNDFVCIFIGVSQWDWDKEITPAMTRWFMKEFCSCNMPADSPTYLFFFGIIYEEDDSPIEQEVQEVVKLSELVNALPELGMVRMNDIGAWFNKYSFIAPGSRELKELRNQYFGNASEHYMEDVQLALQKLIDDYNKKFF